MKKKVGTFKIWLLAIAAVVAFSVLPKVSSLATEDQALVVKENMQEAAHDFLASLPKDPSSNT